MGNNANTLVGKPIENESLSDKVYKIIENNIVNMNLLPGSKINEENIANSLDVSRSPVREAMLKLNHIGLVKKNRSGWMISEINKDIIDYNYQLWEMIESYAAGKACEVASIEDYEKAKNILEEMVIATENKSFEDFRELNIKFHRSLVLPCKNIFLLERHKNILNRIKWCGNYSLTISNELYVSKTNHENILNAYKEKDVKLVEELIREHIKDACERFKNGFLKNNK